MLPRIGSNGSLRIHTRAAQPRTSSNKTFNESIRSGVGSGVGLANSALRQVGKTIPGVPALSATLSDAARNLESGSKLDGSTMLSSGAAEGDVAGLQDEMVRNNEVMLEQQMRVAQITTSFTVRSYVVKTLFETLKTIAANVR